ncbi:MAG TPA: D-glycero-beta-D-manno-heptose 1-phosphate adenylyltransferase [Gemmatimonadales bacterium]|jgi:rfaE bifunctional protein nucleotidyltransferase chain/domain
MPTEQPDRKILTLGAARAFRKSVRGAVVFTNGVFDILHRGHVAYLARARAAGDALIVGLNTDASVRRLGKGDGRPLNREQDRAFVLAGLASVDAVVLFDEATPAELIAALEPDVLAKGADYAESEIVGAELVKARGGKVIRVPLEEGYSTTRMVQTIKKTGEKGEK